MITKSVISVQACPRESRGGNLGVGNAMLSASGAAPLSRGQALRGHDDTTSLTRLSGQQVRLHHPRYA
jgi:hypothetical protein